MSQQTDGPKIEVFTLPTDGESHALTDWLDSQGLAYDRRDLSDPDTSREAVARTGMRIAPVTVVDGRTIWGTAAEQQRRLQSLLWRDLQS
jgi:glutaredoxin